MTLGKKIVRFDDLLQRVQASRKQQLASVRDALRWLVLVPVWTPSLAEYCGLPGMGDASASQTLDAIAKQGACLKEEPEVVLEGTLEPRYRMSDAERQAAIEYLQDGGLSQWQDAPNIAERIQSAAKVIWVPDVDLCWAELGRVSLHWKTIGNTLCDAVERDLHDERLQHAAVWLSAVEPLRMLFGGPVTTAVHRALRRIALYERRQNDRAHLQSFLIRNELVRAYVEFLEDPSLWALHFIGGGGVGKTMLMRYITSSEFIDLPDAEPLQKVRTARVDFDYINPDYPSRRPALLLVMLAEELRLQDETNAAVQSFTSFFDKAAGIHERVAAGSPSAASGGPLQDIEFQLLLGLFVDACKQLALPVVVVLDTCEELSRLGANHQLPQSVEDTFAILQRLHELMVAQGVLFKVIFSGRRPLASLYAGNVRVVGYQSLPERPYIRVHPVLGFSSEEANRFLQSREVRNELREPILERSVMAGFSIKLTGKESLDAGIRYNPFSLSAYAAWVARRSELEAEDIRGDTVDHFIRIRILDRIHNQGVRALLPAVALLGRFNEDLLVAAAGPDSVDPEWVREIRDQEWIDRQANGFYEIEAGLRRRLQRYVEHEQRAALNEAKGRAISYLRRITLPPDGAQIDTSRIDTSHYEALFRLLPEAEAGLWWEQAEVRLAGAGAFDWLRVITERVLSHGNVLEQAEEDKQHPLRAVVLASHAAASAQTNAAAETLEIWNEAYSGSRRHPVPEAIDRLFLRTLCGGLVEDRNNGLVPLSQINKIELAARRLDSIDESLAAAMLTAAERVVEKAEHFFRADHVQTEQFDFVRFVRDVVEQHSFHPVLRAFAAALVARAEFLAMNVDSARAEFDRALSLANEISTTALVTPGQWSDWVKPKDVPSRIRLEYLRILSAVVAPDSLLAKIPPPTQIVSAESDRLAAARINIRRATGTWSPHYCPQPPKEWHAPTCNAERLVAPAKLAWAEVEAYAGFVDEFLIIAQEIASTASRMKLPWLADEASRAKLRVQRRMRLQDIDADSSVFLDTEDPSDAELVWSVAALGPLQEINSLADTIGIDAELGIHSSPVRRGLHARLRSIHGLTASARAELVKQQGRILKDLAVLERGSFSRLSLALDDTERRILAEGQDESAFQFDVDRWLAANPGRTAEALCLHFRFAALRRAGPVSAPHSIVETLGLYRSAVIALDEGELLALRLSTHAAPLLLESARLFKEALDAVGQVIALSAAAMCYARLGDPASVDLALPALRRVYDALFPNHWRTLENIAELASQSALDELRPYGWLPWRIRIIALLAWRADGGQPAERCRQLTRAFARNEERSVSTLPAELYGWLEDRTTELSASELAKRHRYLVSVRINGPSAAAFPIVSYPYSVEFTNAGVTTFDDLKLNPLFSVDPYSMLGHELRARFEWVRDFIEKSDTHQTLIDLALDVSSAWYPWEALLAPRNRSGARFVRRIQQPRRLSRPPVTRRAQLIASSADHFRKSVVGDGWRNVFSDGRLDIAIWSPTALVETEDVYAQVLHLVGRPIETRSGCAIEFIDKHSESYRYSSFSVDESRRLMVTASDISRRNPNLVLCILQDEDQDVFRRTASERERAKLLRIMAAELAANGVPAVVVIPAMLSSEAVNLLSVLAKFIVERREPFGSSLIEALSFARRALFDFDTDEMFELNSDLVLYLDEVSWAALPLEPVKSL